MVTDHSPRIDEIAANQPVWPAAGVRVGLSVELVEDRLETFRLQERVRLDAPLKLAEDFLRVMRHTVPRQRLLPVAVELEIGLRGQSTQGGTSPPRSRWERRSSSLSAA